MRTLLLALTFLVASCKSVEEPSPLSFARGSVNPKVAIVPIDSESPFAPYFAGELTRRLDLKGGLNLAFPSQNLSLLESRDHAAEFLVSLHHRLEEDEGRAEVCIDVEIFDLREENPRRVLSDHLSESTWIQGEPEVVHVSPLGLAHAKLAREVALRIEDALRGPAC